MKNSTIKRSISALLFGAVSMTNSYGMEPVQVSTSANKTLHHIGSTMHDLIQANEFSNNVHCAMGVGQTLALLHAIAEPKIKNAIEQFVADHHISLNTTSLNELLKGHSKPYTPTSRWDDKQFILTNGVYALMANQINVNNSCDDKITALGGTRLDVDFSDGQGAADKLNGIVAVDTHNKIGIPGKELLTADAFDADSVFVLLHTLYVNASWAFRGAEESRMSFKNLTGDLKRVTSLAREGSSLKFTQENGITLVSLPTLGNCNLVIRHCQDSQDLKAITEAEIKSVNGTVEKYTRSFEMPYLSMTADHDLKDMLGNHLPDVLEGKFMTDIYFEPIAVANYVQKVTFDLTDKGIEASAATAMDCFAESAGFYSKGPKISINSPFTFVYSITMNGINHPLFHGVVVNNDVMKS